MIKQTPFPSSRRVRPISVERAHALPMLTKEQEDALVEAMANGDANARETLIHHHMRMTYKMASSMKGYELDFDEIVSQAYVGLLRAADGYRLGGPARFGTYASYWMRAEVFDYVIANVSSVRAVKTAEHRTLFFKLRGAKSRLGIRGTMSAEQAAAVAEATGTTAEGVLYMDRHIGMGRDASLNAPIGIYGDDSSTTMQDLLVDSRNDAEEMETRSTARLHSVAIRDAMGDLDERERMIVARRHLGDACATLEELGREYGVSRERIRQIEKRALAKLARNLRRFQRDNRIELLAA